MTKHLEAAERFRLAREYGRAVDAYRVAVREDPESFDAWAGLGSAAFAQRDHADAVVAFRRALGLSPAANWVRLNLAQSLYRLGLVAGAYDEFAWLAGSDDAEIRDKALANLAVIAPGNSACGNAEILEVRRRWALSQRPVHIPPPRYRPPAGRVRVAYFGSFFASRNWMKMYMGVLNAHDRSQFEINLLVDGDLPCAEAGYVDHQTDVIWELGDLPNDRLADIVAERGIDVLVDLNGYSHQARLPLFWYRPAPVQLAWNGMYGTTGFPGLDMIVGDGRVVRADEQPYYGEKLVALEGTYLAFDPFYHTPPVEPPPLLENGCVTFGCLASSYKITDGTLDVWCAILRRHPTSRLLLRNAALDRPCNAAHLAARFASRGVAADRLAFEGSASHDVYLQTYGRIDIALDTLPYSGGTTTAEALWQGVPVLTLAGDRWASRTSASLLHAAGLSDHVLPDVDGMIALVDRLVSDVRTLEHTRLGQRERLRASDACAPDRTCRQLETLYREALGRSADR